MLISRTVSIVTAAAALACAVSAQEPPKISAELQLKVEVQQLKEQLHEFEKASAVCSAQLADAQAKLAGNFLTTQAGDLQAKRAALEKELRLALGGKDGDEIDWSTSPPSLKAKAGQK